MDLALKARLSSSNLKGRSPLHTLAEIHARAANSGVAATEGSTAREVVTRLQRVVLQQTLRLMLV